MKIMVAGNYRWSIYEEALCSGLKRVGVDVCESVLHTEPYYKKLFMPSSINGNEEILIEDVLNNRPDVLFLYRVNEVRAKILKRLKSQNPEMKVVCYHNDNPYIEYKRRLKYSWYLEGISVADMVYGFRPRDCREIQRRTKAKVKILMPYYDSRVGFGKPPRNYERKTRDVVFIGHYEPDRENAILSLMESGVTVDIFSDSWPRASKIRRRYGDRIFPAVYGERYWSVLSSYKLALCFLSKLNKDVYTRRTFEVPAAGTCLVSEYTKEGCRLLEDGVEAIFFKGKNDLTTKVKGALSSEFMWKNIGIAGWRRVTKDGHSEMDRAKQIIKDLGEL